MNKHTQMIVAIIGTAIIAFGAGFITARQLRAKQLAAGQFQGRMQNQGQNQKPGQGNQLGQPGGRQGMQPAAGEILSSDDKSITVKLNNGGSKIVLVTDKTTINKASEATKADLTTGKNVAVFGTENSDGSVTAETIQLK